MLSFLKNIPGKLLLMLSLLTGLVSAFVNPVMIYFLVDELQTEPLYIGVYTVSLTIAGLIISQWLGALADKGLSSRKMYLLATTGMVLALLVYSQTDSFTVVVLAGIGLTLLQEQLPKRIGFTAAVYSNGLKIGVMFGSTATGIIAQYFNFQFANIGAAMAAFLAALSMLAFSYLQTQEKQSGLAK